MSDTDSDSECSTKSECMDDDVYEAYYTSDEEHHLDIPFDIVPMSMYACTGGMKPRVDADADTDEDDELDE